MTRTLLVGLVLLVCASGVFAQRDDIIPLERVIKSQRGSVTQRIANTDITITYGRPVARGRTLFGSLVPYGRIWHPGADAASTLEVTRDVQVNGKALAQGQATACGRFPARPAWTFIFSTDRRHVPHQLSGRGIATRCASR